MSSKPNTKTRTFIIFSLVIFIIGVLVVVKSYTRTESGAELASQASRIPGDLKSIPGGVTSDKYLSLQDEDNKRRAAEAKASGGSSAAVIIRNREGKGKIGDGFNQTAATCGCCCPDGTLNANGLKTYTPEQLAKLMQEIEDHPELAAEILRNNPGLAQALSKANPELAIKLAKLSPELATLLLKDNPEFAKTLSQTDPELAMKLAGSSTELAMALLKDNPEFAKALAKADPELANRLMTSNAELARILAKDNPELAKKFIRDNPELAKKFMADNPELAKVLLIQDPQGAMQLIASSPELAKVLMKADPFLAKAIADKNPELAMNLIRNDPELAKALLRANPEFAKVIAAKDPALAMQLMKQDAALASLMAKDNPELLKKFIAENPELAKKFMGENVEFAKTVAATDPEFTQKLMLEDPEFAKLMQKNIPEIANIYANQNPALSKFLIAQKQAEAQEKERLAKLLDNNKLLASNNQRLQLNELQQKKLDALVSAMENQSKAALTSWGEINQQQFVRGELANKDPDAGAKGNEAGTASAAETGTPLFKAGSILYAVLDTAINSDEPGPVMATVIEGDYKGAKLLGNIDFKAKAEKVTLNFSTMTLAGNPRSFNVKALGIDPDTARTALASDVDHHYFLRYGSLFASSFLQGFGQAVAQQGTSSTTNSPFGSVTTTTTPPLKTKDKVFQALGEVGKGWSSALGDNVNTPVTVTLDSGEGIGLLFLSDVNAPN